LVLGHRCSPRPASSLGRKEIGYRGETNVTRGLEILFR
jgi:hypothetical protein